MKKMLMKICNRCGKKIKQGEICACQKTRHQKYNKFQRDKAKATFYGSQSWRLLSDYVKARANGLDEYLLSKGQIVKGNVAHHIQTIEERPDLKLALRNLIYVSSGTHNAIHTEYNRGKENRRKMQEELQRIRG